MSEFNENELDDANEDSYIVLTDDDGNDVHFEVLDFFDYMGNNYAVLLPFDDVDDEVVILRVCESDDPETPEYFSIDDDDLLNEVFEEFKKRNAENFDFAD